MSNSSLVNYTKISPNSDARQNSIKKITIHHMAGDLSVETCGNVFQKREASANYGIGTDGRVGLYVDESRRSWASANPVNDHQAVTIEVANDGGAPDWHVSDTAFEKLIELCVDICRRNGISKLVYDGTPNGTLTRHNMFMATTCPGPYLQSRFPEIAQRVNDALGAQEDAPVAEPEQEEIEDNGGTIEMEMRMLSKGMTGNDVHAAMVLMKDKGYYDGVCDDLFGNRMEAGLRQMQSDHDLGVDGLLGKASWTFLLK